MRRGPTHVALLVLAQVVLAPGLLGCATRNAILELEVEVPSDGVDFAELLLVSDPGSGAPDWGAATVERLTERGDLAEVDVLAEAPAIEAPLALGLRLCPEAACSGPPDASWRVERAFYLGRVTHLRLAIPDPPPDGDAPIEIARCAVPGCLEGDEVSDYCRLDGTHYCEE